MNTHFIYIIEELKSKRSSWKTSLTIGTFFEFNEDDKKVEK